MEATKVILDVYDAQAVARGISLSDELDPPLVDLVSRFYDGLALDELILDAEARLPRERRAAALPWPAQRTGGAAGPGAAGRHEETPRSADRQRGYADCLGIRSPVNRDHIRARFRVKLMSFCGGLRVSSWA
jgi:hypothetical protein